jgi:hypothetical protein
MQGKRWLSCLLCCVSSQHTRPVQCTGNKVNSVVVSYNAVTWRWLTIHNAVLWSVYLLQVSQAELKANFSAARASSATNLVLLTSYSLSHGFVCWTHAHIVTCLKPSHTNIFNACICNNITYNTKMTTTECPQCYYGEIWQMVTFLTTLSYPKVYHSDHWISQEYWIEYWISQEKLVYLNPTTTASVVYWLALKTTNTEVPGSIPGVLLTIFLRELGLERGPLSLVIG